ncbi:hypothetical protein GCM10027610_025510 [Dactylosporangium cerinum]
MSTPAAAYCAIPRHSDTKADHPGTSVGSWPITVPAAGHDSCTRSAALLSDTKFEPVSTQTGRPLQPNVDIRPQAMIRRTAFGTSVYCAVDQAAEASYGARLSWESATLDRQMRTRGIAL